MPALPGRARCGQPNLIDPQFQDGLANYSRPIRARAYLDCPGLSQMTIIVIHARADSNFCVIASSVKPNRTSFERSSASLCSEQAPRRSSMTLRLRSSPGPVLISPSEVVTVVPQTVHTAEKSSPSAVPAAITRRSVKSISWPHSRSVSQNGCGENAPQHEWESSGATRSALAVRVQSRRDIRPPRIPVRDLSFTMIRRLNECRTMKVLAVRG